MGIFKFVSKQEGFQTGLTEKFEQEVLFLKKSFYFGERRAIIFSLTKIAGN